MYSSRLLLSISLNTQTTDIRRLSYSNGAICKKCGSQIYLIIVVIIITSVAILARVVDQEPYLLKVKRESQDFSHSFDTRRAVNAIDWTSCS